MSDVNEIIDAIQTGDSVAIDTAFNKAMAGRVSDRLETMRHDVAQNMFKTQEVEDLSAEDATQDEVVDLEATTDELDVEVQDTADAPVEEPAPDVETQEQEV
jgi:hypothetical protein